MVQSFTSCFTSSCAFIFIYLQYIYSIYFCYIIIYFIFTPSCAFIFIYLYIFLLYYYKFYIHFIMCFYICWIYFIFVCSLDTFFSYFGCYLLCHSLLHVQIYSPIQETSVLSKRWLGHGRHGAVTPNVHGDGKHQLQLQPDRTVTKQEKLNVS